MDSDWVALAPQGAALTNRNNREFPSHFAGKVLMRRPDYGGASLAGAPDRHSLSCFRLQVLQGFLRKLVLID
jgi:hypothetical protein